MTFFLPPPGFLGRSVGRILLVSPTNWMPQDQRTFEFQVFEHLDHLIAGCVNTAAKFPPFQPTQSAATLRGKPIRMASFTQTNHLEWFGGCRGDALAEMPLDKPRAQLAFKDSMIRGILQFTLRIAFRCVLHRCKSQDIRC